MPPASRPIMHAHRSGMTAGCSPSAPIAGVSLWDLARGTELAFLPIGRRLAPDVRALGRLDHQRPDRACSGGRSSSMPAAANSASVRRVDSRCRGESAGLQRTDRVGSWPRPTITMPMSRLRRRTRRVGPLNDCRYVAISPDGQWLATGTHPPVTVPQVWRIPDLTKVAELPIDYWTFGSTSAPMGDG